MTNINVPCAQASILWVEDDEDMRDILADELTDAGYAVVKAAHGRQALAQLHCFQPDLILCDIAMPIMDGYELLRSVRETMPHLADVPFVFLSAQDGSGQITQGKHAGADDYLVKPVNFDLMLATISARLRQVQRMKNRTPSSKAATETGASMLSVPADGVAFERLSRMFNLITAGIVLLDSERRTQFANIAAQRMLLDCADSPPPGGPDTAGLPGSLASSAQVRAAIDAATEGDEYTEFLSLPRRNAQRDLLVTICSLDCRGMDEAPAVALFISAGERDKAAPLKALESLFKLTPTEGRVAWAFAQGLRPEQIAETFDISLTTVAFHKRNIFQKTHTNRQADLIALLLTLPASLDTD
ncbi:response regulator [Paracandidimonas soli]|uniref:Regulatory LuxR family protein n=1 Tax=Paracandidimonas soli TaxID=1917182 RepID=A0A4R3UVV8_9BURK|nr:response regulator [Paracandidimonas soli]TCU95302.1 regulatory LuxR family protein [Paracandidimonas soli]